MKKFDFTRDYCQFSFKKRARSVSVISDKYGLLTKPALIGAILSIRSRLSDILVNHDTYRLGPSFVWSRFVYSDLAEYLYRLLNALEIVVDVPYSLYPIDKCPCYPGSYLPSEVLKPKLTELDIEICVVRDRSGHLLGYVPVLDSLSLHAFRSVTELRDYLYSLYPQSIYKLNLLIN